MKRGGIIFLMIIAACIGYVTSVKHINMDSTNLLIDVFMIIASIHMPFYMRDKRDKLKGVTYKQFVVICVILGIGALGHLIFHFVGHA
ncbi:MAG TPA: hypothetical protein VGH42_07240 [Verrucomicrobiae bacterium]